MAPCSPVVHQSGQAALVAVSAPRFRARRRLASTLAQERIRIGTAREWRRRQRRARADGHDPHNRHVCPVLSLVGIFLHGANVVLVAPVTRAGHAGRGSRGVVSPVCASRGVWSHLTAAVNTAGPASPTLPRVFAARLGQVPARTFPGGTDAAHPKLAKQAAEPSQARACGTCAAPLPPFIKFIVRFALGSFPFFPPPAARRHVIT